MRHTEQRDRASLLIVDDERGPTESLRMVFKSQYDVYTAPGGEQALDILHSSPIDVVTLDLRMPGMPGTEVMEHIKRIDPDIEIIVVTGYACIDSATSAVRYHVFDYVTKPFDVPHISDLVERAVARRRAALRARRVKEHFLANLSHELRTPLSVIIGYSAILNEELKARVTEDQRLAFDRVQANSQKLLNLIETVLLLNSLDAGELELTVSAFDVRQVLRRAALQFGAAARQRDLTLMGDGEPAPLWVSTDQHKLERIIWALIDNAITFTPKGTIQVEAKAGGEAGTFQVEVRDTGIGVRGATIEELIGNAPPAKLQPEPAPLGLGLGLRMASRLAEFLGGHLGVSSGSDAGSVFTITLPVDSSDPRPAGHHDA